MSCREYGIVHSTTQTICKNRNKIIGVFERNESKIKQFRKPEQSDISRALLKWFK